MPVEKSQILNSERVFVVFDTALQQYAARWFCRPGFSHCWAFWPVWYPHPGLLSTEWTTKLELTGYGIHSETMYENTADVARDLLDAGVTDIVCWKPAYCPAPFRSRLFSCVTLVKARLGINEFLIWTPQQLYRYLLQTGGVSLRGVSLWDS